MGLLSRFDRGSNNTKLLGSISAQGSAPTLPQPAYSVCKSRSFEIFLTVCPSILCCIFKIKFNVKLCHMNKVSLVQGYFQYWSPTEHRKQASSVYAISASTMTSFTLLTPLTSVVRPRELAERKYSPSCHRQSLISALHGGGGGRVLSAAQ